MSDLTPNTRMHLLPEPAPVTVSATIEPCYPEMERKAVALATVRIVISGVPITCAGWAVLKGRDPGNFYVRGPCHRDHAVDAWMPTIRVAAGLLREISAEILRRFHDMRREGVIQ